MENSQSSTNNTINNNYKDRRFDALGDFRVLPDETICEILEYLTPRDVARLSCVSSVMYILCNEEPLWMSLCLTNITRQLEYKGSWKKTTLHQLDLLNENNEEYSRKPRQFDGFSSLFLYRRLYRCYTTLEGFSFENGNVERKEAITLDEFHKEYDGQKPVVINGLAEAWPARSTWTTEMLLSKYGETAFRISQRSSRKITMKFKDYVSYMQLQHDEDPLYIFDDKFGEVAHDLLNDYTVPDLFQEDFFDVLDREQRPPFRWLIIGPERSGASWHVDPALTSAWNTLLCGRKRWALYPPGRVPLGVTVHINEEDGDVNIDTPSSLQWWLDFYPLLADEDKPIEYTQLPGETIYVPSGWWHCVLNLETTIAVTQNYVNAKNFEYVCLDMAPGFRHKGVCRAGLLALDEGSFEECMANPLSYEDLSRKEKRIKTSQLVGDPVSGTARKGHSSELEFSYDINFLAMFLDKERDHYNALWSTGNCIGQREMRDWLFKLWAEKPGSRDLIWKGACLALNAAKWYECMEEICAFHDLPSPSDDERLPVGTGSNPVYLVADNVIKIFVEGGLEASLYALGSELEFHSILNKVKSPLKNHIPDVLASGIIFLENGLYRVVPWDGKGVPDMISDSDLIPGNHIKVDYPFGIWNRKQYEYQKSGMALIDSIEISTIWPYIITKRCRGKIFAELRESLSLKDTLNLASFLGDQVRNLHLLPYPSASFEEEEMKKFPHSNGYGEEDSDKISIPTEWNVFIRTLNRKKKSVTSRLTKWGDPIPSKLIEKVHEYIPSDFAEMFIHSKDEMPITRSCTWIHSDVMDDNIHMEPCHSLHLGGNTNGPRLVNGHNGNGSKSSEESWQPTHILDFSDLSIGDPIYDVIPVYLDVFRGDSRLLKHFLKSYKLPFVSRKSQHQSAENSRLERVSYLAMSYCIVHDENVLGAIFSLWKELRTAESWEEVEETVWGELNSYVESTVDICSSTAKLG